MSPAGDRDDGRVVVRTEGEQGSAAPGTRALGMLVFLASLSMLFGASIVGYLVIRFRAESWPPPGAPSLPPTLWLSTALALGCSGTVQLALAAIRAGSSTKAVRWLTATLALAVLFVANQGWSWVQMTGAAGFRGNLYGFTFVMLTGLHGLHVIGGVVALVVVLVLALRGLYTRAHYAGVRNCALYWHYLSVVWLVLFGLLLAG